MSGANFDVAAMKAKAVEMIAARPGCILGVTNDGDVVYIDPEELSPPLANADQFRWLVGDADKVGTAALTIGEHRLMLNARHGMSMSIEDLERTFDELSATMTFKGGAITITHDRKPKSAPTGGGLDPAKADRIRRKNKRRGRS